MPRTDRKGRTELLPQEALRAGFRWWCVLVVLASAGLLAVLLSRSASAGWRESVTGWAGPVLIGVSLAWQVLLGGVVLLLRSYCFRALWDDQPVEPGSYLKGMRQVWGVLMVGALLAVLGSLLMGAMMPGVLVVLASLVLLLFSRPSGRALGV